MSSSDVSSNFLKLLPQYDCHKRVGALKIALVLPNPRGIELHFTDESVVPFQMSDEWDKKHSPYAGGYLVAYADGYLSFSPPAAFEQGYKPVSDDATNAPCWSSQAVLDILSERRIQANNRDFAYDDRRTKDELVGAAMSAQLLTSNVIASFAQECSVIAKRDGLVFVSVFWGTDGMYGLFKKQTSDC